MTGAYVLRPTGKRNPWLPDLSQIVFWVVYLHCLTLFFIEFDTFWHIKVGQWIWHYKKIPLDDLGFSVRQAPLVYKDHEWLSQLVLYGLWKTGGFFGLRVILGLIPALIFRAFYIRLRMHGTAPLAAILCTVILASASAGHWLARPHMLGYLCLLGSLIFWEKARYGSWKATIGLALTQVVWVNLHGSFVLQFFFGAAYFFQSLVPERELSEQEKRDCFGHILFSNVLVLFATLLNPEGWRAVMAPITEGGVGRFVSEWQPGTFEHNVYHYFVIYAVLLLSSFWVDRKRLQLSEPVIFLGLALLASTALRHIAVFVYGTLSSAVRHLPYLFQTCHDWLSKRPENKLFRKIGLWIRNRNEVIHEQESVLSGHSLSIFAWSVTLLISVLSFHFNVPHIWDGISERYYPVSACEFMKREGVTGNAYNEYAWGGYIIYQFNGAVKVFVDGRAGMYGSQRLEEDQSIARVSENTESLFDKYDIDIIVIDSKSRLARALSKKSRWGLVHSDAIASVFVRRDKFPVLVKKFAAVRLNIKESNKAA